MKTLTYKINPADFVISHAQFGFPGLLRDGWDKLGRQYVQSYFDRGYKMFLERLELLKDMQRQPTEYERKELAFMLEALMDAKEMLRGE